MAALKGGPRKRGADEENQSPQKRPRTGKLPFVVPSTTGGPASAGKCNCCSSQDDDHLDHAKARQSQDTQAKQDNPTLGLRMEEGNLQASILADLARNERKKHAKETTEHKPETNTDECSSSMQPETSDNFSSVCDAVSKGISDATSNGETLFANFVKYLISRFAI